MANAKTVSKGYPLYTMLVGLASFIVSGTIFGLISVRSNEVLIMLFGIPVGSLLMLFLLRKLTKGKILPVIFWSVLGGFFGFFLGFGVGEGLSYLFEKSGILTHTQIWIIPTIVFLIFAGAVFAASLAFPFYGRKAAGFFALLGAVTAIPFGLLLTLLPIVGWFPFDQNMLIILASYGAGTGLGQGLYALKSDKRTP